MTKNVHKRPLLAVKNFGRYVATDDRIEIFFDDNEEEFNRCKKCFVNLGIINAVFAMNKIYVYGLQDWSNPLPWYKWLHYQGKYVFQLYDNETIYVYKMQLRYV